MLYRVSTFRGAGLQAKWFKTRNAVPYIGVRDPNGRFKHQKGTWWMVDIKMFEDMKRDGVMTAFTNHTLLGDMFSISA